MPPTLDHRHYDRKPKPIGDMTPWTKRALIKAQINSNFSQSGVRVIRSSDHRDLAVFTIVQDEPEFIHPWINHYRKQVADPRDIHVLVHAPTRLGGEPMRPDELPAWQCAHALMTSHHGVTVVPVHHSAAFDHRWLAETVARFQSFLLQSYDWVLFAEADEFVLPMPDGMLPNATLLKFVRRLGAEPPPAVRATGFEIIHQSAEPPVPTVLYHDGSNIDLTAGKLIEGRKGWYPHERQCKTLLANIPLRWQLGFHMTDGIAQEIAEGPPSPSLALVHLHKVDFDLALRRSRRSRARNWSQFDVENRLGWQNRIEDEAELRAYWDSYGDTHQPLAPDRIIPIAPGIKQALR
jgi:hypothetical protein